MAIELAYINTKHPDFHRDVAMAAYKVDSEGHNKSGVPALPHPPSTDPEKTFGKVPCNFGYIYIWYFALSLSTYVGNCLSGRCKSLQLALSFNISQLEQRQLYRKFTSADPCAHVQRDTTS